MAGRRPGKPGQPQFTNVTATSFDVSWSRPSDSGSQDISMYKLRRWNGPAGHGDKYYDYNGTTTTRHLTGLVPRQLYGFAVYAYNGTSDNGGYSDPSDGNQITLVAGAWVRYDGRWLPAIPYVRYDDNWLEGIPYVRYDDNWLPVG